MRKIKNCMKIGILAFGILLMLTNCEKEDNTPITTTEQQILSKSTKNENVIFSNPDYSNIRLKLNENIKKFNSNNTISFENKFGKPLYKSSIGIDSKFKTLITPMYDDKTILLKGWLSGFYNDSGEIKFMYSVANENQIEILDLKKGNLVLTDKKKSKIKIKKTNKKYAAKLICGSSYRYICGTVYSGDGHGETSCDYYYEGETCVDVGSEDQESDTDEGGGDWEDPFDGGGGNSGSEPVTDCGEGYYLDEYGNCQPDIIINNLFGYSDCVYKKLENSNLFRETIGKFINNPDYHIQINLGNCPNTNEACTSGAKINEGLVVITIEGFGNSALELAATILHEGIHAEMYRYVAGVHNGDLDPNDKPRLIQLYNFYGGWWDEDGNTTDAQHWYMTEKYVKPIANAIQELDNFKYPIEYYMGYGWDGLRPYGYESKLLTSEESSQYSYYQQEVNNNTNFGNDCK